MRPDRTVIVLLSCILASPAAAQAPRWPDTQTIERARERHPFPSDQRLSTQPLPALPRIEARPGGVDIEAIARGRMQIAANPSSSHRAAPLRIFITLDMPKGSLERLSEQAGRVDAVLVLRGLKANSMRDTLKAVQTVIGEHNTAWTIDPEAFTRFGITQAPTFVLSSPNAGPPESTCTGTCVNEQTFVSIAGDVSLDYALEAMGRLKPELRASLTPLLERLR